VAFELSSGYPAT